MFDVVDYSIAMKNGNKKIKEKANFITDTNDNLGIVKGLQKLKLI
jgi:hydroxymethylpyrimidine pyrophosphatase-like HAD family hydrolase